MRATWVPTQINVRGRVSRVINRPATPVGPFTVTLNAGLQRQPPAPGPKTVDGYVVKRAAEAVAPVPLDTVVRHTLRSAPLAPLPLPP